jgi:CRP/FNR family cyclic AMP-dependent transcriptional regulator
MIDPEAALWAPVPKESDQEPSALEALQAVPLFADLRRGELRQVLRICHLRTYQPGEVIFREGDPGYGMYVLHRGAVDIVIRTEAGERALAQLGDRQFFGEMSLLDGSPRSASAVAKDRTQLVGFFQPDLETLIERDPRLGSRICWNLARLMASRLRAMNEGLRAQRPVAAVVQAAVQAVR